jgi:hypothetical protein
MSGTIRRGKAVRADLALWDGRTSTYTRTDATGGTITGLAIGNEVDVLQVFGSGTDRTRAAIASATNHIGSSSVTLVFAPGTWTIDDDLTIASNFTCHIPAGCVFSVSSGKTLTFSGDVIVEYPSSWTTGAGSVVVSRQAAHGEIYHRSTAEIAASVTPEVYAYGPAHVEGHILRYIPQAEHAAILAGTSTYDASDDLQDWLDSLHAGSIATVVGTVCAQGLLLKKSDVEFRGGGWIKPTSNASSATVLTIGDDSDDTLVRRITGHLKIGDISSNYTSWTNITGLKLVRCVEFELGVDVTACAVGMDFAPTESAVAYNLFRLGMVYNNQIGIRFNPSGNGFSNENTFLKGRFGQSQALSGVGIVGVQAITQGGGGGAPDQNIFYGPTFELAGKSVYFNGGDMCRFHDVRFEPITTGTAGVDYESILIDFGASSSRNSFEISMNPEMFSGGRQVDHGAATRTDDHVFTLSGDLRGYFYPMALIKVTVGGTDYFVTVRSSSFGSSTTTVTVNNPLITSSPTAVVTPRISNLGVGTAIRIDRADDPTLTTAMTVTQLANRIIALERSMVVLQAMDADHPALTLVRGSNDSNRVIRAMASTGETAYLQANGNLRVSGFGLSATPAAQQATISDPSGGATQDAEARTAINTIIDRLQAFGLIA